MMSGTSEAPGSSVAEASKTFTKLYIDKIKKEEDEEQWISGEELFTEGSSDEDAKTGKSHHTRREHKGARPKVYKETPSPRRGPGPQNVSTKFIVSEEESDEEPVISWKPKRGSIKLPNLIQEKDTTEEKQTITE